MIKSWLDKLGFKETKPEPAPSTPQPNSVIQTLLHDGMSVAPVDAEGRILGIWKPFKKGEPMEWAPEETTTPGVVTSLVALLKVVTVSPTSVDGKVVTLRVYVNDSD